MHEAEAWATLGLEPGASADKIRAAFREKARYRHPDNHPERDEGPYAELMQRLTDARDVALDAAGRPAQTAPSPSAPPARSPWRGVGRWIGFWRSKA